MIMSREIPESIKEFVNKELAINFDWVQVHSFVQDTLGVNIDEVYHPPTYNWKARINVRRKKDGMFFQCTIPEYDKSFVELNETELLTLLKEDFSNGVDTLETFATCDCTNELACAYHKIWYEGNTESNKEEIEN